MAGRGRPKKNQEDSFATTTDSPNTQGIVSGPDDSNAPSTTDAFEGIKSCFVCGKDNPIILVPGKGKFCSPECVGRFSLNK